MAEELQNISLSSRKRYTIDDDPNRVISLDTTDMNIVVRFDEAYPQILDLATEATNRISAISTKDEVDNETGDEEDEENPNRKTEDLSTILKDIDRRMRDKMDYIFASPISDVCEPTGNMFDPVCDGQFRFEHIIWVLGKLYETNFTAEFDKMQKRLKKHTEKYTSKYHN